MTKHCFVLALVMGAVSACGGSVAEAPATDGAVGESDPHAANGSRETAAGKHLHCRLDTWPAGPEIACTPGAWCGGTTVRDFTTLCRTLNAAPAVDGGSFDPPNRCGDGWCGFGASPPGTIGTHRCESLPDGVALCVLEYTVR